MEKILERRMSRKSFLKTCTLLLLGIVGTGSFIKLLEEDKGKIKAGYGLGAYGG